MSGVFLGLGQKRGWRVAVRSLASLFVAGACCPAVALATSTPPNPPTNLTEAGATKTTLTLTWTPSTSSGVVRYNAFVPGGASLGNAYGADATTMTITGLTCSSSYWIDVVAFDSSGNASSPAVVRGSTSLCDADIGIVANTPSDSQAHVGQDVTFTIVAANNGPDAAGLYVRVAQALDSLRLVSITCDRGISNDGTYCEYGKLQPGETRTTTIVGEVQDTGSQSASDVACVSSPEPVADPDPRNDCRSGTVQIMPVTQAAPTITGVPLIGTPPANSPPPVSGTGPVTATTAQIRTQLVKQLAPAERGASIAALLRNRGYTFWFDALSGGRVVIAWYYLPHRASVSSVSPNRALVASGDVTFSKARPVKVTIRLTATGRRVLGATKRLTLTAKGSYIPTGSSSVTAIRTFALRRR